jgi:hypothetical protein
MRTCKAAKLDLLRLIILVWVNRDKILVVLLPFLLYWEETNLNEEEGGDGELILKPMKDRQR